MNTVIYCSCTGHSKAVAENLAARLGYTLADYTAATENYSTAVIVFPVHCQSYPAYMKEFFKELKAENVALIATYGMANAGNAIFEAAKLIPGRIVAAAYVPVGHSYLNDDYVPDELPNELIDKIKKCASVAIPRRRKTPFAGFMPSVRSRLILKIKRTEKCVGCNICGGECPVGAIKCGKINRKCVRCLKCVASCPHGALEIKKARILARYLKKANRKEIIIY